MTCYRKLTWGWPTVMELDWLCEQARELSRKWPVPRIVHLGVERGCSLHATAAGAPTAEQIGVDLDVSKFLLGPDVRLIQGNTAIMHSRVPGPIHLLFVDADHNEDAVRLDILNWTPKVAQGGLVVFHDYANGLLRGCAGVKPAVDGHDWRGWQGVETAGSMRAFKRLEVGP